MEGRDDQLTSKCPYNFPCQHTPECGSTQVNSYSEITAKQPYKASRVIEAFKKHSEIYLFCLWAAALDKFAPFLEGCFINTQVKSISKPQEHMNVTPGWMLLRLGLRNIALCGDGTWNHQILLHWDDWCLQLSSGNVKTMKVKAEHNNTRSHQELSDQPFEGWKTRTSAHVEIIVMSTLLEGCVENTELHDWREPHSLLPNKDSVKFRHREELKGMCWVLFGGEKL